MFDLVVPTAILREIKNWASQEYFNQTERRSSLLSILCKITKRSVAQKEIFASTPVEYGGYTSFSFSDLSSKLLFEFLTCNDLLVGWNRPNSRTEVIGTLVTAIREAKRRSNTTPPLVAIDLENLLDHSRLTRRNVPLWVEQRNSSPQISRESLQPSFDVWIEYGTARSLVEAVPDSAEESGEYAILNLGHIMSTEEDAKWSISTIAAWVKSHFADFDPDWLEAAIVIENAPAGGELCTSKPTVDEKMIVMLMRDMECVGWPAQKWADQLGCSKTAIIQDNRTWKIILARRAQAGQEIKEKSKRMDLPRSTK